MDEGKLSLAEKSLRHSLEILAKSCPACILEQSISETNLGMLRMRQRKYGEADQLLSHAITLLEQSQSSPGIVFATTLRSLANVREKEQRHEDAAQLQKRADLIAGFR